MSDIFISYANEDLDRARTLAEALEQNGLSVWWDRDIPPGKSFAQVIKERLDEAKCVIVLWSRHSVSSNWVKDEASEGVKRNILVPVIIDDVDIPLGFRQLQTANLVSWRERQENESFGRLLRSVRALIDGDEEWPEEPKPAKVGISFWRRSLIAVVLALLGFFYAATLGGTCANPDWVMITIIVGFLVTAFLLIKVQGMGRFVWILGPAATFVIGMPYGHGYGSITRSPLFDLKMGAHCQVQGESYYLLAGLFLAAVIIDLFYVFWSDKRRRWIPLVSAAVFISAGAVFAGSYLTRYSEQFEHAEKLTRKYRYFSLGAERWNSPTASGFSNGFSINGNVVKDAATGLVWQASGSRTSIGYSEIPRYLNKLNTERLSGFDDWRLPSLAEAWTLLEHNQSDELYIDPIFDGEQGVIWTSTLSDDGYGWFIFFKHGRPRFQNAWGSHAYIRAVRGPAWE